MKSPIKQYRHLKRYQEIVRILIRHGFGGIVDQLGLLPALSLPSRLLRRQPVKPHLTPAVHVRLALEDLGPTFIKFGQILSTRPDLVPPAYIQELEKLQDVVPPAPWDTIKARIETELETPLEEAFTTFDPTPIAAASISQVHQATLPGGENVVVKVQRPDIERTIDADLEILFDLAHLLQERTPLGELYDLVGITEDFTHTLRAELDFSREGRNADRFRTNFAGEPHLYIPKIYWDHTTRRVIVLEHISGLKIDDLPALEAAGFDRHQIALYTARIIIQEMLIDGFFHADPHPGNFFILCLDDDPGQPVIGAVDFGMVGHLSLRLREELIHLYGVSVGLDSAELVDQLIKMGAAGQRVDRDGLQRDLERLLTKYYGLPLKEIRAQEIIDEVMPIAFRHHLRLPAELWLMGKTLGMMEGIGLKLDPDFDVFAASKPYVRRFTWQMASPKVWGRKLLKGINDWEELFTALPKQTHRILDQMERGDLEINLSFKETQQTINKLDLLVNRLSTSILLAALIVGLALLTPLVSTGGYGIAFWLAVLGFLAVATLGLSLLISMWRGRR
ncbi:MAG: AarF/ABC1/UbiB kinase family protein [Chloroflexota bacterium]|nr:AarF/ABC1/UbiB kinase family protein [Chloroflexota bacterium]